MWWHRLFARWCGGGGVLWCWDWLKLKHTRRYMGGVGFGRIVAWRDHYPIVISWSHRKSEVAVARFSFQLIISYSVPQYWWCTNRMMNLPVLILVCSASWDEKEDLLDCLFWGNMFNKRRQCCRLSRPKPTLNTNICPHFIYCKFKGCH